MLNEPDPEVAGGMLETPAGLQGPGRSLSRNVKTDLAMLWLAHLCVDLFTGIWPIFKTLARIDLAVAGLVATVSGLIGNALQLPLGYLGDRGYKRQMVVIGVLLVGAIALAPQVSGFWMWMLLATLTSIGSAFFHPSASGISNALQPERRATLMAWFATGGYVGFGVSHWVFTSMFRSGPENTAWLLLLPAGVGAILIWHFSRRPAMPRSRPGLGELWRATQGVRRELLLLYFIEVAIGIYNVAVIFLLPEIMLAKGASPWLCYGGAHLIMIAGSTLGLIPAGHLADRMGTRQVMFVSALAAYASTALLLTAPGDLGVELILGLVGVGIFGQVINPLGVSLGNSLLPKQGATVSALLMGLAWCGASVGTVLCGYLAQAYQSPGHALWVCASFAVLTSGLVWGLRERPSAAAH